ncbi:MAG: response regulator transcription factor [Anaerolineae bacterium]
MKVLIVDDDLVLADVIAFTMRRAGFEVTLAHDGRTALDRWQAEGPDLIILDLKLPRMDGLSVCRHIRAHSSIPIIMLSVRSDDGDIVEGLNLGADDYITKPFSPAQLVARCQSVLRRAGMQFAPSRINSGPLTLDPTRREVVIAAYPNGKPIRLTQLEYRLLEALVMNPGQVLRAELLIDKVWSPGGGDKVMLKQLVHRLRRKIEINDSQPDAQPLIETVPGIGYAFLAPPDDAAE